jgi:hypothetical protein
MKNMLATLVAMALVAGTAQQAGAQSASDWRRGTTLAGFAGAASPTSGTDLAAGTALGWELAPHFTVEGRGLWFGTGGQSEAFAALIGARVPFLPARKVVPFASGSVGVYRATVGGGASTPSFYRRRMGLDDGTFARQRTFDDFVVAVGGGFDVFLATHLALRPEVTVLVVTTRSDTRTVPVYGMHLAYHFESHPITPTRR